VFTGREGKQVPAKKRVKSFKEILEANHDDVPEGNFLHEGGIAANQRSLIMAHKLKLANRPIRRENVSEDVDMVPLPAAEGEREFSDGSAGDDRRLWTGKFQYAKMARRSSPRSARV